MRRVKKNRERSSRLVYSGSVTNSNDNENITIRLNNGGGSIPVKNLGGAAEVGQSLIVLISPGQNNGVARAQMGTQS